MRNAEAARATACVSADRFSREGEPEAARCASEPRRFASCGERHAEVTKTASVRGGAVCLPCVVIPESCPAMGVDPQPGRPFFLKSCCRCRRRAPKGAGCCAVRHLAETGTAVVLHEIRDNHGVSIANAGVASGSTALDRRLRDRGCGGRLPALLDAQSACIPFTTLPAFHKALE